MGLPDGGRHGELRADRRARTASSTTRATTSSPATTSVARRSCKLYSNLYKLGIEQGTFIGEFHDATTSDDHACALIKYRIVVGKGMEIPGEAIGVFHIENGQMVEYWLLERDQKMINDIMKISGKASLAGGSNAQMALGALKQPAPLARTIRRVLRVKRGNTNKML